MSATTVSVVIPTLEEQETVGRAIASVRDRAEVIVVDGGSRDATARVAAAAGARVLTTRACRGLQQDAGARAAGGAWLVFLHADTRLEAGWAEALESLGARVVGGAFRFALHPARRRYRLVEAGVALRCRLLRLPFGDQALFVRREVYGRVGGFPALPLMEDLELVRRLRREGPLAFPSVRAWTSARRWERHGLLRTTLANWALLGLFALGMPARRLARLYAGASAATAPRRRS